MENKSLREKIEGYIREDPIFEPLRESLNLVKLTVNICMTVEQFGIDPEEFYKKLREQYSK